MLTTNTFPDVESTATPIGFDPTVTVAVTAFDRVSITDTVPSRPLTTYAACAAPSAATTVGYAPTVMVAVTVFDRVSITETVLSLLLVT